MKAAAKASVAAAEPIPLVDDVLAVVLNEVLECVKQDKKLDDQCDSLRESLPDLLAKLDASPDASELVRAVRLKIKAFSDIVNARNRNTTKTRWLPGKCGKEARVKVREFKGQLARFRSEMETFKFVVDIRTLQIASDTHGGVEKLDKKVDKQLERLDEMDRGLEQKLDRLLAHRNFVRNILQGEIDESNADKYEDDLRRALKQLRHGHGASRLEAQQTLIRVSLDIARNGNEDDKMTGLNILDELMADSTVRPLIMRSSYVVKTLLDMASESPTKAIGKTASKMLEDLASDSQSFFAQLVSLSKLRQYHRAIVDADIAPWIVASVESMNVTDETALGEFFYFPKTECCKTEIVLGGGVAVLAERYQKVPELSENAPADRETLDVIKAMASLSEVSECRDQFAKTRDLWPLLHFVWKCNTLRSEAEVAGIFGDDYEYETDIYGEEQIKKRDTAFDRSRVSAIESKAGRALWDLSQDDRSRDSILRLSAMFYADTSDVYIGELATLPERLKIQRNSSTEFDYLYTWLRMAEHLMAHQAGQCKSYWILQIALSLLLSDDVLLAVAEWFSNTVVAVAVDEHMWKTKPREWTHNRHLFGDTDIKKTIDWSIKNPTSSVYTTLVDSTSRFLMLPQESRRLTLEECFRKALSALNISDGVQKTRALKVLWVFLALGVDYKRHAGFIVGDCRKLMLSGTADDAFWAISIHLKLSLNLQPVIDSLRHRLNDQEWRRFVILAKHVIATHSVKTVDAAWIPFLVASINRIIEQDLDGNFGTASYFESKHYRVPASCPFGACIFPINVNDWVLRRCYSMLSRLQLNHADQIVAAGGRAIMQRVVMSSDFNDDSKKVIRQHFYRNAL